MSNQNYDQVPDLGLKWATDPIVALLMQGALFDATHTRVSQTGGFVYKQGPIQHRWVAEGDWGVGLPVAFPQVASGQSYQVLVARNDGSLDLQLLAFLDEDQAGHPISVQRDGTLIVRPSQENLPVPPDPMEPPPTVGFWMKL